MAKVEDLIPTIEELMGEINEFGEVEHPTLEEVEAWVYYCQRVLESLPEAARDYVECEWSFGAGPIVLMLGNENTKDDWFSRATAGKVWVHRRDRLWVDRDFLEEWQKYNVPEPAWISNRKQIIRKLGLENEMLQLAHSEGWTYPSSRSGKYQPTSDQQWRFVGLPHPGLRDPLELGHWLNEYWQSKTNTEGVLHLRRLRSIFRMLIRRADNNGHIIVNTNLVIDEETALAGRTEDRAYACAGFNDDGTATVYVAPKILDAKRARMEGILAHELGHVFLLQNGNEDHSEREADRIAEMLFGFEIYYDKDDVQSTQGGKRPRPEYLDVKKNPGRKHGHKC